MPAHSEPARSAGPLEAGQTFAGRYEILSSLGSGGFSRVYKARDSLINEVIALKLFHPPGSHDDTLVTRFKQELSLARRLVHPNVIHIYDIAEHAGTLYLSMELVDGRTLAALLAERGPLSSPEFWKVFRPFCVALAHLHSQRVIHRDIKPHNVMLDSSGVLKLMDFGIARDLQSETTHGPLMGTPGYVAPELIAGGIPSPASDIYSAGVMFLELLAGKVGLRELPTDTPTGLARAIRKCLRDDPSERFQTVQELVAAAEETASVAESTQKALEMAYVLFMDLVSYSTLPMDSQTVLIGKLQTIVRGNEAFQRSDRAGNLISLPTGDGMALVFFQDPVAPVECALGIARSVRQDPQLRMRMGIHTGPVFRIADINANRNVAGGGINLAQRVMDCGDAGHILVSKSVADVLSQLSQWAYKLHEIGEHRVKHGVTVHLFNVYTEEAGNPTIPSRLRRGRLRGRRALPAVAGAIVLLAIGLGVWLWPAGRSGVEPAKSPMPSAESALKREPTARQEPARAASRVRTETERPPAAGPPPAQVEQPKSIPFSGAGTSTSVVPAREVPPAPPQWAMLRGSASQSGYAAVLGPRQPRIAWEWESRGSIRGSPVIAGDGTVYFGDTSKTLQALHRDGQSKWSFAVGGAIVGTPAVLIDGTVVFGAMDGKVYALQSDGSAAWTFASGGEIAASAILHRGNILIGSRDGVLYALHPSGKLLWRHAAGAPIRLGASVSSDGVAYVPGGTRLLAVNTASGALEWTAELDDEAAGPAAADPDGRVYVTTAGGTLHCLDRQGRKRWSYRAEARILTAPAVNTAGDVLFGGADRLLYAVRDGEARWKFAASAPIYSSPVVTRGGTVYFGSQDGYLYAVDDNGREEWRLTLRNDIQSSPALSSDGSIYVGTVGRRVFRISN